MSQYFSFQWHITDECDQRCKHCYIFSGEGCRELKSMIWDYWRRSYPSSGFLETDGIAKIEKDTIYPDGKSFSSE